MPFPWNELNVSHRAELLEYYRTLGKLREKEAALDGGHFYVLDHTDHAIAFVRERDDSKLIVAATRGRAYQFEAPCDEAYEDILTGQRLFGRITVDADRVVILRKSRGTL
jgi:glycosidase